MKEVVVELSPSEFAEVDALAARTGLSREAMIAALIRAGLPSEEARAALTPGTAGAPKETG